jgi:hypothetical protein
MFAAHDHPGSEGIHESVEKRGNCGEHVHCL